MDSQTKPGILVKNRCETNSDYGCTPQDRKIEDYLQRGIANLDKPSGPTSHQVTAWVKGIFNLERAGHSGTLDPKVTGVLPVAFGQATKILSNLLLAGKTYVGILSLHQDLEEQEIMKAMEYFQGKIIQKPPIKSAVKRQLRLKNIYRFELLEKVGRSVLFEVDCEAGTYIRKLCHDLGYVLGGKAQMSELRRIRVGPFTEEGIIRLHDLRDSYEHFKETGEETKLREYVQPVENAVSHLNKIWIKDSAVDALCHGAELNAPGVCKIEENIKPGNLVAAFTLKDEVVAVVNSLLDSQGIMEAKRGPIAKTSRVVMEPGTYPKGWKTKT
ncbi:RNA-guided pseudouridylation complex pseudouridine synthase subunit Cbf5 [Candidatus Altiarchaeota archaeon]